MGIDASSSSDELVFGVESRHNEQLDWKCAETRGGEGMASVSIACFRALFQLVVLLCKVFQINVCSIEKIKNILCDLK